MTTVAAHPRRHVEHCMGTVFSIDVRAPGVEHEAITEVLRWLHWVDATFSTYREDSHISRLGRGEIAIGDCPPEVREVLDACERLTAETDGYFDAHADGRLDPSGYVKGWAIEQAAGLLTAAGSLNHCVNGGGDVQCAGDAAPGRPWRVGISDPARPGELVGVVRGTAIAVATSGCAERGSHIVDPHTGRRPDALHSVSIVGRRLSLVDAHATAAFAMGAGAQHWIAARDDVQGLLAYPDGRSWSNIA